MNKSFFVVMMILKVQVLGFILIGGMVGALPVFAAWLLGCTLVGLLIIAVIRNGYTVQLGLWSLLVMLLTVYFYGA